MMFNSIIKLIVLLTTFHQSNQHGRMLEPPSRNSMWRTGFNTKPDYDDSELFCGGIMNQWKKNGGKCGICGDSYSIKRPRPYETGGEYASNITVRVYAPGSEMDVIIDLVANHMGTFEFSICPRDDPSEIETEDCFIPLKVNGSDKYKINSHRKGLFTMPVEIPRNLSCEYCVFRWHWKSANNWGVCPDGKEAVGCGPQETYRNCADITISHEHGIRGTNYDPLPKQSKGNHNPNHNNHNHNHNHNHNNIEFERLVMNEVVNDDHITYHSIPWPKDYSETDIDRQK